MLISLFISRVVFLVNQIANMIKEALSNQNVMTLLTGIIHTAAPKNNECPLDAISKKQTAGIR